MDKKRKTILTIIVVFLAALIITGGSYAFWSWTSGTNKNIIFNTASNLKEYINYDAGESKFVGDFKVGDDYTDGIHSTISLSKTSEVANLSLLATIHMDIKEIGNNMKVSPALKWTVTKGTSTNVIEELANGNFIGTNAGDTLTLVPNINVTTEKTDYTIWIWLDEAENPSDLLTGEKLSTNVWTEINQLEGAEDRFEITRINANYQTISATVVDNKYKVTHYAIATSDSTPSSWIEITPSSDKNNVYNLTSTDNTRTVNTTYYVWFKDENNRTTYKSVKVTAVDTTPPSCTWGSWSPVQIANNDTASITLTCTDNESEITISNLTTSSITKSNNNITITNITKTSITNGYKYTVTVKGTETDGETTLTLPANSVKNAIYPKVQGNAVATSDPITIDNNYTVKFATGNNNCPLDSTTYADYTATYGTAFTKANPSCTGYTFTGWTANSGLDTSNAKYGTSQSAVNTTWSNGSTPVTATWFIDLANKTDKTVTLTATWTANNLTFNNQTLNSGTYGIAYTSDAFTGASGGTGSYTYAIKSGAPTGATINSTNRTISFTNSTNAGTYSVVVTATDTKSGKTKDATMTIVINRQGIAFPSCDSKVYNGSSQELFVAHDSGTYTNDVISGTNVGTYRGNLTPTANYQWNSGDNVTSARELSCSITQKTVTITAASQSRAWDNSALTNNECTGSNLPSGHTVTCTMTSDSTITTAGSVANTISTYTIKNSSNADVTSNYDVTTATGTLTITLATPTVSLTAKETNWTGSVIAANTATASPDAGGSKSYTYYTDSSCSTQTTTSHGASATGEAPSAAGQYYVKATVAAVANKTNIAYSACTSHIINKVAATISCSNKTYDGTEQTACSCSGGTIGGEYKATNYSATAYSASCTPDANHTTPTNVTWTMSKHDLTSTQITAYTAEMVSTASTYTRTVSTGIGSETVTLTYTPYTNELGSYTYATSSGSGTYTLSQSNSNYLVSSAGNLTIDDTTPPTISSVSGVAGAAGSGVITGSVVASDSGSGLVDTDTYSWYLSNSSTCPTTNVYTSNTNTSYDFVDVSSSGTYYVCVKATDVAGNTSAPVASAAVSYTHTVTCSAGSYYNGSTGNCTQCPAGSYCPGWTGMPDNQDHGRTACTAGKYNASTGSSAASACVNCAQGSYSSSSGATSCTACTGGKTNSAGTTSCTSNCSQTNVSTWNATSWSNSPTANNVSNLCSINKCATGYTKSNNTCSDVTPPNISSVSASLSGSTITATVSASDTAGSLHSTTPYAYYLSTSSTCPTTNVYTGSTSNKKTYTLTSGGTYYVCVKVTDAAGNSSYKASSAITYSTVAWHMRADCGSSSFCVSYCPGYCQSNYSTSVWSCYSSKSIAPSSASLDWGKWCWCKY